MLETIISVQPRTGGGGGGKSNDEIVGELVDDLEERCPADLTDKSADPRVFAKLDDGSVNPLGIFFSHEMAKFNKLLKKVRVMLSDLARALKGLVVMSAQLDAASFALLYQQVPEPWGETGAGFPSLKPLGSWYKDMIARVGFMRGWLEGGPPNSYWVSGFFFPQGFFTSALQSHARKHQLAIDMLRFGTQITPYSSLADTPSPPESGVHIHGMMMEGARFDGCFPEGRMGESKPGELWAPMNVVWLRPIDQEEYFKTAQEGQYECPFYKTNLRTGTLSTTGHSTNHVCNFLLPSDTAPQHWMRRGAALISQTND